MRIENIFCAAALWGVMVMNMSAQSSSSAVELGKKTLKKAQDVADKISKGKFDSTYVALPEYKWMVTVSGNANYNKFRMKVPIPDVMDELKSMEEDLDLPPFFFNPAVYTHDMNLHNGSQSMAIGISYASIRAKYSFDISNGNDQQLTFETLGSKFGGYFDYRRSTKMRGSMYNVLNGIYNAIFNEPTSLEELMELGTTSIKNQYNDYTTLHVQGHYVFNSKHFAYSAARSASRIQKKSAGSFIALADLYYSRANFQYSMLLGGDEKFRTGKISVGGGYGYNWTPNAGKLLVHASFMPTLTVLSNSTYSADLTKSDDLDLYDKKPVDEVIEENRENKKRIDKMVDARAKLTLNCTARFSVTWNIDKHFVLGGYGSYMYSNYKNKESYSIKEHYVNGDVYVGYRF